LFVRDEESFLLFFKNLFGKPGSICNLPNFRKVVSTVWQHHLFANFDCNKMIEHLKLWCLGIELPINPAHIPLHKLVFEGPENIKRTALLLRNCVTHCNINGGDCMGLTPLLLAIHANRTNVYEEFVKSGANLFRCPLTLVANRRTAGVTKKGARKVVEVTYPRTERRQFNVFEILMFHKQYQQIVNLLSHNEV
jgi:hypothetical protein